MRSQPHASIVQDGRRIPSGGVFDATFALKLDPYGFIRKRCERLQSDVFETRVLLKRTYCMSGPDAAELFYNRELFRRGDATPLRVQATLFGRGGVQTLDGEAHVDRKRMFLSTMGHEAVDRLGHIADVEWRSAAARWRERGTVELYREAREVLCAAVCAWAGVRVHADEMALRTTQLTLLFDAAGSVGPKHWGGRVSRLSVQQWLGDMIGRVRAGELPAAEGTALHAVAFHRGLDGNLLDARTAAVELLNVLRPTVAVAVFVVFAAHALHMHPEWRTRIAADASGEAVHLFVQEVRRFYPFFPAVMATTCKAFEWRGLQFDEGVRAMLDLYGTDHDPRVWSSPDEFRPERIRSWQPSPFTLIPQGGGDTLRDHRCPGEWITLELMRRATRFLVELDCEVPPQDLAIDMMRLPALPKSRMLLTLRPRA